MKGNDKVIQELNAALSSELMAIMQYMVHAEMLTNWGYQRYGGLIKKQAIDEMKHAEGLIERILYLDGVPNVHIKLDPKIGNDVKAQIENDLAAEVEAVTQYNNAARICVEAGDNGSREIFERMTIDEEQHVDFLEAQLDMIKQMGLQNYLAQQMKG
jgi:bacterioferritin